MITFSGLASGLDSGSIIDQVVAAERLPALNLERRKSYLDSQKSILSDLTTKLKALEDAGKSIDTLGELRAMKGTSSAEDNLTVAASHLAQPSDYTVRVASLAASQTNVSASFATADPGVLADGNIDITVGTDAPVNVAWTSADSLYDVASNINASEARVNASVLFDGTNYRLMVSSEDSGVANAVTFSESSAQLTMDGVGNELIAASDAQFTLNGLTITSPSNVISSALPGITFTLTKAHEAGDPDATVTVETDPEAQLEVIQTFVDAYNEVADVLQSQLSYSGETRGEDTLFGDSTLRSLQSALRGTLSSAFPVGTSTTSIGQLGLELDTAGKLTINETELAAADPDALQALFLGEGVDGVLTQFGNTVSLYTQLGDGLLENKVDGIDDTIRRYDDQIERIEANASRVGEQLAAQFTRLEESISIMQSQGNYLLSILGGA